MLDIIVPSEIDDKPVTAFKYDTSYYKTNLIKIPSTVTKMDLDGSFNEIIIDENNPIYDSRDNCKSAIETATNTLLNIGDLGFIPDTVTCLDENSFYFSDIKEVVIPASVISIPDSFSFTICDELESVKVDENNPVYDSRDNCNGIIETETNRLIASSVNGFIPNTVNTIDEGAFEYLDIKEILIPSSVTNIKEGAFCGLRKLESVKVDENNPVYDSRNNCNGIIDTKANKLICGFNCTIIPKYVFTIASKAFYCVHLDYWDFTKNSFIYEDNSFYICTFEKGLVLPELKNSKDVEYFNKILHISSIDCLYLNNITLDENVLSFIDSVDKQDILTFRYLKHIYSIICSSRWHYVDGLPVIY